MLFYVKDYDKSPTLNEPYDDSPNNKISLKEMKKIKKMEKVKKNSKEIKSTEKKNIKMQKNITAKKIPYSPSDDQSDKEAAWQSLFE